MRPTAPARRGLKAGLHGLAAALALLACWPGPASADAAADAQAAGRARLDRVRALRLERPGDGLLAYYQAIAHAGLGERDAALAELRGLLGRRLGLVPARGVGFEPLWDDAGFQALRQRLADEEVRSAEAPVAFIIADSGLIPEGVAFDPVGDRFFIGSIARHKIIVGDGRATTRDFSRPADRLDAVLGLAVDAPRRSLYAVSTNAFEASAAAGLRNAVLRYDLDDGRMAARLEVAAARQLNDVAVAADGTVYATDSAAGSVWRLRPGEPAFAPFVAAGDVSGANGIAVAPDGIVYVTLSTGIARIDPADGRPRRMAQPDSIASGGIDGLYWHEGDLLGVQNSTNPGRVVRLRLADDGQRIEGLDALQSHHHPAFAEPTTGAIARGALHVLANTYVGDYEPDGTVKNAGRLLPTRVLAVPLRLRP